jgi:hypothetical protein
MLQQLVCAPLKVAIADRRLVFENPEVPRLFELLSQLIVVSTTLRDELSAYFSEKADTVAKYLQNVPRLLCIFFEYIQAYHVTSPLLRSAQEKNPAIAHFFDSKTEKLGARLDSFLITPVQRPPRYRLLFQELLKNTAPESPDFEALTAAVSKINEEVGKLNAAIEEYEEATAMAELSARLSPFEVFVRQRRLFFQGESSKFSRKRSEVRYLIVFSDTLVVAEVTLLNALSVNKLFATGDYQISDVTDRPPFVNSVDIRQKEKSFRVNMKTAREKAGILAAFADVCKLAQITNLDLELKGFAPVWIPDDLAPFCMECNEKFTFINRRHHCRSCGDCICGDCFGRKIVIPGLDNTPQGVCTQCYIRIRALQVVEQREEWAGIVQTEEIKRTRLRTASGRGAVNIPVELLAVPKPVEPEPEPEAHGEEEQAEEDVVCLV